MTSRFKIYATAALAASMLLHGCGPDAPVEVPEEVTAPANVRLVASDKTSLVFAWDEVKGADFYVARLETSDGTLVPGGQTSTKETSIKYDGLAKETSYSFKVRTKAGETDSP